MSDPSGEPAQPAPTGLEDFWSNIRFGTVRSVDKDEYGKRREAWTIAAAEEAARVRKLRSTELDKAAPLISRACDALTGLLETGDTSIRVRRALFADEIANALQDDAAAGDDSDDATTIWPEIPTPDPARSPQRAAENPGVLKDALRRQVDRRPPWARLGHRPSRAGALWLTAAAVAHATRQPGQRARNDRHNGRDGGRGWATLLAAPGQADDPRRTVVRSVQRLTDFGLAGPRISTPRPRWDNWMLFAEDGTAGTYTVPEAGEETGLRPLPREFFTNGWHLVLTHAELHVLLMIVDLAWWFPGVHSEQGVFAVPRVRRWEYGMSDEVYLAHRTLAEFGLIERLDGVHGRRAGKVRPSRASDSSDEPAPIEPFRFQLRTRGMKANALEIVRDRLVTPIPPRFDEFEAPDPLASTPH